MKNIINLFIVAVITLSFLACGEKTNKDETESPKEGTNTQPERPTDAELMAFKVYHHMVYMVTTSKQAGGTNKLLHTKKLPTAPSPTAETTTRKSAAAKT